MSMNNVSEAIQDILRQSRIEGMLLYLPPGQLDRKVYQEVNEVLERLGGKWNRKQKAHVFASDPTATFQGIFAGATLPAKNPCAHFATPPDVVELLIRDISTSEGTYFLEPSAGTGVLAQAVRANYPDAIIDCCEIDEDLQKVLQNQGYPLVATDFLAYQPGAIYDVIVMNPPFSLPGDTMAYITHIEHAWTLLKPGGELHAIAPPGYTFNGSHRARHFFAWVQEYGRWEMLPDHSFKVSGTNVATTIIHAIKPVSHQRVATPSLPIIVSLPVKAPKHAALVGLWESEETA